MKYLSRIHLVAITLILAGVLILAAGSIIRYNNASLQTAPVITSENRQGATLPAAAVHGKPVELKITALNIQNGVIEGVFDNRTRQWTLTTDKAQFALMTAEPNDTSGLTFIYGHNRKEVFNRLPSIKPGTLATVQTNNGYLFTYRFTGSQVVSPADISVFTYDGPPKLVLQTCTGLFYQNRQLFTFEYVGVSRV